MSRRSPRRQARRLLFGGLTALLVLAAVEGVLAGAAWLHARRAATGAGTGVAGVFCVGDSNVQGIGAPEGESWPAQLERDLARRGHPLRVANGGVSGFRLSLIHDRLLRMLEDGTPRYVVLMGGFNDNARNDLFLWERRDRNGAGPWARLRTVRMAAELWRHLRHGAARAEQARFARLDPVELEMLDEEERLAARLETEAPRDDGDWYFRLAWRLDARDWPGARRAFEAMLAAEPAHGVVERLRFPPAYYRWELDMLSGSDDLPVLEAPSTEWLVAEYAAFTRAHAAMRAGRWGEARAKLEDAPGEWAGPYFRAYVALWIGWAFLLEGRHDEALTRARDAVERLRGLYPRMGLAHGVALAALAWLKANPGASLPAGIDGFEALWRETEGDAAGGDARAWLDLARRVEADRATPIPARLPRIPLFAPTWRATILRDSDEDAIRAHVRAELEAIVTTARRRGFTLILSDYLDERATLINRIIAEAAREHDLPFVDLQGRYAERLAGPDRDAWFSSDLHHPNARGYRLVAGAVADVIARLEAGAPR